MKRHLTVLAALAMSLMSGVLVPSLQASRADKSTTITIFQSVTVNRTTLPPGKYVLRMQDFTFSRSAVYIFNAGDARLISTAYAIHAYRQKPTDRSKFSFYNPLAGQPAALHLWFYPGDDDAFEFLRHQHTVAGDPTAGGF
jgi:hypothetical protein